MNYSRTRKVALSFLALLVLLPTLTAGSCQTQEQKEITLANVGLVLNKSINEGVKSFRTARNEGLIGAEKYHAILNRVESAQNLADELNKQLDAYAMVDGTNKAALITAFGKTAQGIDSILNDPLFNGLAPELVDGIKKKAKYAATVLSIASNVVGLIERPTSTKNISFTVKGVD